MGIPIIVPCDVHQYTKLINTTNKNKCFTIVVLAWEKIFVWTNVCLYLMNLFTVHCSLFTDDCQLLTADCWHLIPFHFWHQLGCCCQCIKSSTFLFQIICKGSFKVKRQFTDSCLCVWGGWLCLEFWVLGNDMKPGGGLICFLYFDLFF